MRAVAVALMGAGVLTFAWPSAAGAEPESPTSVPTTSRSTTSTSTTTVPVDVTAPVEGDGTRASVGSDPQPTTTEPRLADGTKGPDAPLGATAVRPVDEDLGEYGLTPPPDEFAETVVAALGTASSTASPSLAGTGRGSGRLARMALVLGLGGVLLVVADRSDRSRAALGWAYRSASRRSRERDDLLPASRTSRQRG